jgi:hypothetical protein
LVRRWDAVKYAAVPWHVEQSVWTFRYGIRAAHTAHSRFLKGQSRFPRFKARHRDRPRFTTADGLRLQPGRPRVAKCGWVALAAPRRAQAQRRRLLVRGRAWILNITVSRDAGGCWYASVRFGRTSTAAPQGFNRPLGAAVRVDVGGKTAAVVATAGGTPGRHQPSHLATGGSGLSDSLVSRRQAKLLVAGLPADVKVVEVVDLGIVNAISVGCTEVPRAVLKAGDRVGLGEIEVEVRPDRHRRCARR